MKHAVSKLLCELLQFLGKMQVRSILINEVCWLGSVMLVARQGLKKQCRARLGQLAGFNRVNEMWKMQWQGQMCDALAATVLVV